MLEMQRTSFTPGLPNEGMMMKAIAAKFLDFKINWKLRTSRTSPWKPRGLVVNVQSR